MNEVREREKEKTPKKRKRKDEKKHHGIVGDGGVSCLWLRFSFSDDNDENDWKKKLVKSKMTLSPLLFDCMN